MFAQQLIIKKAIVKGVEHEIQNNILDFGKIKHKDFTAAKADFIIINEDGLNPLIITQCQTSCGCTTPTCPKQPIPPKGQSMVSIQYDADRLGVFDKKVVLYSNAQEAMVTITLKGEIVKEQ